MIDFIIINVAQPVFLLIVDYFKFLKPWKSGKIIIKKPNLLLQLVKRAGDTNGFIG